MTGSVDNPYASSLADPLRPGQRASWARYRVLAWLCAAATIAYICRNSIAVAESTIRKDLGVSEDQMGWVMSAFFLTYAFAQIPSGIFGDLLGTRRALPILAAVWSVATGAMSLALGMWILVISRLANGLGQAGIFPCCTNTIARWFSGNERATAAGALASFMSLGGALGGFLTGVLLLWIGWRGVFFSFTALGIVWAIGFYYWFRDDPTDHQAVNEAELKLITAGRTEEATESTDRQEFDPTPWLAMIASPAMWCICGQQFFRGAGYMFFASWFPTYLQETRNVSVANSGMLLALPMVAVVIGSFIGGIASDAILVQTGSRRLARQLVSVVCLLACTGLIVLAFFIADPLLAVLVISAGTLCFAFAGPNGYAITIDMGGAHVATTFSTMNMAGNIGALVFPVIVPKFREATSWESVLFLFAGMFLAAAVFWALLNPNGTIFDRTWFGQVEKGQS